VTADGGFLISDRGNNVVRKVSSAGVITRIAGSGTVGHSGDDGPATDAQLSFPNGLVVTADGEFLIADSSNQIVRAVSAVTETRPSNGALAASAIGSAPLAGWRRGPPCVACRAWQLPQRPACLECRKSVR
jgi:sugar lactone lactonase YvrE